MEEFETSRLVKFEEKIAGFFDAGLIRHPIHLTSGNEQSLIEIFKRVGKNDWVFCSWRSHYHALLKGVPETEVESKIMKGHSIALNFPEYKFHSSAIVGGHIPISVGVAIGIQSKNLDEKVWCFVGDMTSQTGIARVSFEYAENLKLPIEFVIEDNNRSVCTDTRKVWNSNHLAYEKFPNTKVTSYSYESKYPHAGAGKRVQF